LWGRAHQRTEGIVHRQRIPRYATIAIVALGVAWVGLWISTATSHGTKSNAPAQSVDYARLATTPLTDAELAKLTSPGLIAVADVDDSGPFLMTPTGGGAPPGVGARYTNYSLRLVRVLRANPDPTARTVTLQVEGEPIDLINGIRGEGPDFYPEVGKRYLVVAAFYDGHYFIAGNGGGFTEIDSPEQEAQLVDYWIGLIGATPVATSVATRTAVGTTGPTEQATEPATETAVPTAAPTDVMTKVPTEISTNAPTDEPTTAPTETPTDASTETPTIDAGSSTPTPTSGP
jgi:hypothetical protein